MFSKQKRIGMYNVFVDSLSGWVKAVRSLVQFQINRLIMSINTKAAAVFNDSDVAETLSIINGQYVVSSDKTPYNFLFLLAIMLSALLRYTDSVTPNSSYWFSVASHSKTQNFSLLLVKITYFVKMQRVTFLPVSKLIQINYIVYIFR